MMDAEQNRQLLLKSRYIHPSGQIPAYEWNFGDVNPLKDLLSSASYTREANELLERGLYLDVGPWSYHVFTLEVEP
jgi:hypothetical protein